MANNSRLNLTKEEIPVSKHCTRFSFFPKEVNEKNAIVYLKLRKDGCNRKAALAFSSKVQCKTDITKMKDGPSNFRKLRVKKNPIYVTTNGWTFEPPIYDLGPKYHFSPNEILHNDAQSKYFETHFGKHEEKIKEDYKKKLNLLRDYFDEINSKCQFTGLSRTELYQKLKRENAELKRTNEKTYDGPNSPTVNNNNNSSQDENKPLPLNLIDSYFAATVGDSPEGAAKFSRLNSFYYQKALTSRPTMELKPIDDNDNSAQLPSVRRHVSNEMKSANSISKALEDKYSDISEEEEGKGYTKFRVAYEELENQTNMLFKMTNEQNDHISGDYFMGKRKKGKNKLTSNSINSMVLNRPDVPGMKNKISKNDGLADEFNKINYFYLNQEKEDSAPGSPSRKLKASEDMKIRKEQRLFEKTLFDRIFNLQTKKRNEQVEPNSKNLETLKAKQKEIRESFKNKVGVDPYLFSNFYVKSLDNESPPLSPVRSGKTSHFASPKNISLPGTTRSATHSKSRDKKTKQYSSTPREERINKPPVKQLRIDLTRQGTSPIHVKNKSILSGERTYSRTARAKLN